MKLTIFNSLISWIAYRLIQSSLLEKVAIFFFNSANKGRTFGTYAPVQHCTRPLIWANHFDSIAKNISCDRSRVDSIFINHPVMAGLDHKCTTPSPVSTRYRAECVELIGFYMFSCIWEWFSFAVLSTRQAGDLILIRINPRPGMARFMCEKEQPRQLESVSFSLNE